jgi:hypothetical protein
MSDRWIRGHFGDEVRPRPEFLGELERELASAWPAPSIEPEPALQPADDLGVDVWGAFQDSPAPAPAPAPAPQPPPQRVPEFVAEFSSAEPPAKPSRRRGTWVAAAALVLLLGAGLAYVAMRDTDKGSVAAPGDTVAAVTTVPGATVEPGAATTEPSGSETPTSDGVATTAHPTFDPACVEQAPSGAMPSIDESAAATLGPLSASPTLTITLPRLAHFQNYETPTAYALRVPGGVLLKVDDYGEAGDLGGTMLVLLGVDGGVRWVRCLPTTYVQGATWDPVQQQVAVLQSPFEVWYPLSLADGTIGEQAVATPPEREWPAQELPALSYVQVPSDTSYVLDVIGIDEAGAELWRDSTLHVYGGEAFNTSTVDGIGLAVGCEEFSDEPYCIGPHMRAYDPADGTVRWDVPGVLDVGFIADGLAMVVTESGESRLLSLSDGSFLTGQWSSDAFGTECCGGSDYHFNVVAGGVVVNVNYGVVTVWYPASMNLGSHEVSLS